MLSKIECSALRAIAIISIMLHNYCHAISYTVKENEFQYFSQNNMNLWSHVLTLNHNFIFDLLSFFGHYGVPVFLFISGYGLCRKYGLSEKKITSFSFIRYHFIKLLRLMFFGYVISLLVIWATHGHNSSPVTFIQFILQLSMLINLSTFPSVPGPYWYFGLTMQLYLLYILIFCKRKVLYSVIAVIFCLLIQLFCNPEGNLLGWLRGNFVGSLLPFCVGICSVYISVIFKRRIYLFTYVISIIFIFLMGFNYQYWLVIPVFVVLSCISLIKMIPYKILKYLDYIGSISASLFVVHPIIRSIAFRYISTYNLYIQICIYLLSCLLFSVIYKKIIEYLPSPSPIIKM